MYESYKVSGCLVSPLRVTHRLVFKHTASMKYNIFDILMRPTLVCLLGSYVV